MNRSLKFIILFLLSFLLTLNQVFALTFPSSNYFRYGDFYSYSLPILSDLNTTNPGFTPDPLGLDETDGPVDYTIDSSPGLLDSYIRIYTGSNGHETNIDNKPLPNGTAVDDAYPVPGGSISNFSTGTTADPNGAGEFTGDTEGTWDISLGALDSYLNGSDLFFFFNNNQTGADRPLFAWARATLVDTDSVLSDLNFDFTNSPLGGEPNGSASNYTSTGSAPNLPADPTSALFTDWVLVPGEVCFDGTTMAPIDCSTATSSDIIINHNLGANEAAYGIFSPELNEYMSMTDFGGYDVLQVDLRLRDLNNGFEQLFIATGHSFTPPAPPNVIPEPSSVLLLGLGLVGVGIVFRKRR